jgi:hypothetical protein
MIGGKTLAMEKTPHRLSPDHACGGEAIFGDCVPHRLRLSAFQNSHRISFSHHPNNPPLFFYIYVNGVDHIVGRYRSMHARKRALIACWYIVVYMETQLA